MAHPVVHSEIIGTDPGKLRDYYAQLFGWSYHLGDAATETVSDPGDYGFVDGASTGGAEGTGINGGVGGGAGYQHRVLFYVAVDNVEVALTQAERLGGTRMMGPEPATGGDLVVGWFTDPEGHLVGVAGAGPKPT